MAELVRVRRLMDQEGQKLQRIVRRGSIARRYRTELAPAWCRPMKGHVH
ncbi:hypothetical protein [Microbispora rosea]|nr:hypothetical protein [Microbispora rosea]